MLEHVKEVHSKRIKEEFDAVDVDEEEDGLIDDELLPEITLTEDKKRLKFGKFPATSRCSIVFLQQVWRFGGSVVLFVTFVRLGENLPVELHVHVPGRVHLDESVRGRKLHHVRLPELHPHHVAPRPCGPTPGLRLRDDQIHGRGARPTHDAGHQQPTTAPDVEELRLVRVDREGRLGDVVLRRAGLGDVVGPVGEARF